MTDAIVAGHLCLDIIPDLSAHAAGQFDAILQPGRLVDVGAATSSTGGAVSNSGLALHRLGIETRLPATIGADHFGRATKEIVAEHTPALAEGITINAETSPSYTVAMQDLSARDEWKTTNQMARLDLHYSRKSDGSN